jgi:hypothetical protein
MKHKLHFAAKIKLRRGDEFQKLKIEIRKISKIGDDVATLSNIHSHGKLHEKLMNHHCSIYCSIF